MKSSSVRFNMAELPAIHHVPDEGEMERHAMRMRRQLAIRDGSYLPPLPHLPLMPLPADLGQEVMEAALEAQLEQRRQFLLENIRPEALQQPGFFNPHAEDDYNPISPTNSDDEADEQDAVLEVQRNVRRNWRRYMNQRRQPLPQEFVNRLLDDHDQWANAIRNNNNMRNINNNNNNNFRNNNNNNGVVSPSPSPSPAPSPAPSEDMNPIDQAREDDEDIEMLNAQLFDLRPIQRLRKRQNTGEGGQVKRKRVTFKDEVYEEQMNSEDPPAECNDKVQVNRKQFDDDDEGFYGGPSARHNQCA